MRLIISGLIGLLLWGQAGTIRAEGNNPAPWRTIVIDPGHGGEDAGAKGLSGTTEKELTLKIAAQLAQLITRRLGLRVVLTRNKDESLPQIERIAIANNNKANLFISLHVNADMRQTTEGLAVYVLDRQSLSAVSSNADVPELAHWDSVQKNHWQDSLVLAQAIHGQVSNLSGVKSQGVLTAPLLILKGAAMPAVLIEVGFISHPQEEEKLIRDEYQKLLAEIILEGILQFKRYGKK